MSDLRELMHRWFDEVWNQGRSETIDEMVMPDAVLHGLGGAGGTATGPEGFRPFHTMFRSAFPDIRITIDDTIVEGDQVCVRLTFTGTHLGDGIGLPPTGRRFTSTAIVWVRWRAGRMVEAWNEFDADGMLRQLTAAPAPAQLRM
jgi:predicted ester cyclase